VAGEWLVLIYAVIVLAPLGVLLGLAVAVVVRALADELHDRGRRR